MPPSPAPVDYIPSDLDAASRPIQVPEKGIGLCLSGGGYRAMLFHVGALWRLQELRLLDATPSAPLANANGPLVRISSVSGGSITSALVGLRWPDLLTSHPDAAARVAAFKKHVAEPIRALSEVSLAGYDTKGKLKLLGAILLPGTVNDYITRNYAKHLYGEATLQSLPDEPRFVLNASNLQSGALWRFSKPYMWDWRVGKVLSPKVSLARVAAASSAFPPMLSPAKFEFGNGAFVPGTGGKGDDDLQRPPFTTNVELSDGGVYDNLGLETVWKGYKTVLVSDAGKPFDFEKKIGANWLSQSSRVINLIDNQVRSLRKRSLIESYETKARAGTYWGIDSDIATYPCAGKLPCPREKTQLLATITTDLAKKSKEQQERLINWGYAICDAAVRSWVDPSLAVPTGFPLPQGVG